MAAKTKDISTVSIPALEIKYFNLRIVGDSALICHAWDEKAKKMMLDKSMKKATSGKEAKRPCLEYANTLYWLSEKPDLDRMEDAEIMEAVQKGRFGFPVTAFKASAINGAFRSGVIDKMTVARGAFHIDGEMAEINGVPSMREDTVKIGMSGAEVRYRAEFLQWETVLSIRYNERAMSMEQIVNLFNTGGFACGVGDWRPEKDGSHGMYHVA